MLPSHPSRRRFLAALPASAAIASSPVGKIRIGQIGTRHAHASGKLAAIRKFPDLFELVGVVEPDPARRAALSAQAPYQGVPWLTEAELLATPDLRAAAVETAVEDLVPTAMRCLHAGLHLHLDKPAGVSLDECQSMHRLAADRGLTIQMGYMLRYNPAFQFLHRIVREGWLGDITEVSGMMGKRADPATRRDLARFPGGGMFELACHLIDQVVWLLGPPERVVAHVRRTFPDQDDFADNQLAVFEYPRALAEIRCNHADPFGGPRRQFSVTGTKGTMEIRPLEPPQARLALDQPREDFRQGWQDVSFPAPPGRYDEEFLDLARVLRGEHSFAWSHDHDVATHEAVLRASGMLG